MKAQQRADWEMGNIVFAVLLAVLAASPVYAGGPLESAADGTPYLWNKAVPIAIHVDGGDLGAWGHSDAVRETRAAFNAWTGTAIPTSGLLPVNVIEGSIGDVATEADLDLLVRGVGCTDTKNPVIYDDDGTIFAAIFGQGTAVLGFAGVCPPESGFITEGFAVLNGEALSSFALTDDKFRVVLVHEFGHFINLGHSQVNGQFWYDTDPSSSAYASFFDPATGGPPRQYVEVMFPYVGITAATGPQKDDIAAVSRMYPSATPSPAPAITGTVFLADGETAFSGANVIARNITNPFQDAVSNVSGHYWQTPSSGQNIQGAYELPGLTGGATYTVEVTEVLPFSRESRVGPLSPSRPLLGPEEFYNGLNESADNPPDDPSVYSHIPVPVSGIPVPDIDIKLNKGDHGTVLIVEETVYSGMDSSEVRAAYSAGFTVEMVTAQQWRGINDFTGYKAIIFGDKTGADTSTSVSSLANSAWANQPKGNIVIMGADPATHYFMAGAKQLMKNSIEFAGNGEMPGLYIATEWAVREGGGSSDINQLLDQLTGPNPLTGFEPFSARDCDGPVRCSSEDVTIDTKAIGHPVITGTNPPFSTLTDYTGTTNPLNTLDGWENSVHVLFNVYPADFSVIAMDNTLSLPYIIARSSSTVDTDGDGLKDDIDNCPANPNPDQKDIDGEGVGDACDNCYVLNNPNPAYPGPTDTYNPDQADTNGDGIGDACSDADGDGIPDNLDNCPKMFNPSQADTNGDGIGDACTPLLPILSKSFNPASVAVGAPSTMTLTIQNPNATAVVDMTLTDLYPTGGHPIGGNVTGMINATPLNLTNTCNGTVTANAGGNSLSLSDGTIAAGGTCTIEVQVKACPVGNYENRTSVLTSNAGSTASASALLKVGCPPGNTYTGNTGQGDFNCDGIVNSTDLTIVTSKAGFELGMPGWDPAADPNCDGRVNISDTTVMVSEFETTY